MTWAFHLKPHPGELLSGYLCRTAVAHGATPFSFLRAHIGDEAFWARDVDRGAIHRYDGVLGKQSGLGSHAIREMTLHSWMLALTPSAYAGGRVPAIIPWINAGGVFHRLRRLHGLQFCQECLAESRVLDKRWRLSFMTTCSRHEVALLDACPHCDAPFIPHRCASREYRCHACNLALARGIGPVRRAGPVDPMAFELQTTLYALLERSCEGRDRQALADLNGLRVLVAVLMTARHGAATAAELELSEVESCDAPQRMETMRASSRQRVLQMCARLLATWPAAFRSLALSTSLRREDFDQRGELPSWLRTEVEGLASRERRPKGKMRSALDSIDELGKQRPANWRAARAALMVRAARGRR